MTLASLAGLPAVASERSEWSGEGWQLAARSWQLASGNRQRARERPVTCLVTDRRRLPEPVRDSLVLLTRAAAEAGVDLIQIREPDLEARPLLDLTRDVLGATAGTATAIVVNERVDVAMAAGAHGAHLRGDSVPAERVRMVAPAGFLVGRSVHTVEEAMETAGTGIDYLIMGTVYASRSKPGVAPGGVAALAEVCRAVDVPVLAIGGVTPDRAGELARAGAAGIAAIGLFSDALERAGPAHIQAYLADIVWRVRTAFTEGRA